MENKKQDIGEIIAQYDAVEQFKTAFTEDDVIKDMPVRSMEEIIREVAEEEGMTEDEVMEAIEKLGKMNLGIAGKKRMTKAKRNPTKVKAKKKTAKKSKRRNR
jgi:hypothetical protein